MEQMSEQFLLVWLEKHVLIDDPADRFPDGSLTLAWTGQDGIRYRTLGRNLHDCVQNAIKQDRTVVIDADVWSQQYPAASPDDPQPATRHGAT